MNVKETAKAVAVRVLYKLAERVSRWGWRKAARGLLQSVLRLIPGHPLIHVQLSKLALKNRDWDTACAYAVSALTLAPGYPQALFVLACSYTGLHRNQEALSLFEMLDKQVPGHPDIRMNLGFALWRTGYLEEALTAFRAWTDKEEYRTQVRRFEIPDCPLWDGSNLDGKTILLWADQGFGDALQMIRYVPLVTARGGTVVVGVPPELSRLFSGVAGISRVVTETDGLSGIDCHVPLFLLPTVLHTTRGTIPILVPYLAPPAQVSPVPCRVSGALKVGVVWAGNTDHEHGVLTGPRSLPFPYLYPLLTVPGVEWYSLQVGPSVQELSQYGVRGLIHDLSPRLTDFAETAGVIQQLDVVISVDTAVAHLAGALGVPTWVLLPYVAAGQWMVGRTDSPWYPTMTLFRQTQDRVWIDPVLGVMAALSERFRQRQAINISQESVMGVAA